MKLFSTWIANLILDILLLSVSALILAKAKEIWCRTKTNKQQKKDK